MTSSDHVLTHGHAPTPFTAAQIRDACPDGLTVETRTLSDGAVIARGVSEYLAPDAQSVTLVTHERDASGAPVGDPSTRRVDWIDLQRHASFPATDTTVTPERIVHPLGELDCLRYEVAQAHGTHVFWFALAHPGMPVRFDVGPPARRMRVEVVAFRTGSGDVAGSRG